MRHAVVTGGGTGVGRAVAGALAARGDQVVITGRRAEVLAKTAAEPGPNVRALAFDASDPGQVAAALQALPEKVAALGQQRRRQHRPRTRRPGRPVKVHPRTPEGT